ncbi:hypothetical protein AMECASPLE_031586 [Ameca splendens]|uniref:Reverse transcriptase domain-containing protein n=1 Tax=Ameca splendens TaxID=208324 RepID=A0ABV0Z4L5_9TELE
MYARILFVDFSSTFNTISPDILHQKLIQLKGGATEHCLLMLIVSLHEQHRPNFIFMRVRNLSTKSWRISSRQFLTAVSVRVNADYCLMKTGVRAAALIPPPNSSLPTTIPSEPAPRL